MSTDTFEDELRALLRDTADAEGPAYVDVAPDAVLVRAAGSSVAAAPRPGPASRRRPSSWPRRVVGPRDRRRPHLQPGWDDLARARTVP